jgi:hypothetical protein
MDFFALLFSKVEKDGFFCSLKQAADCEPWDFSQK